MNSEKREQDGKQKRRTKLLVLLARVTAILIYLKMFIPITKFFMHFDVLIDISPHQGAEVQTASNVFKLYSDFLTEILERRVIFF